MAYAARGVPGLAADRPADAEDEEPATASVRGWFSTVGAVVAARLEEAWFRGGLRACSNAPSREEDPWAAAGDWARRGAGSVFVC